jgi:hypothetical protein
VRLHERCGDIIAAVRSAAAIGAALAGVYAEGTRRHDDGVRGLISRLEAAGALAQGLTTIQAVGLLSTQPASVPGQRAGDGEEAAHIACPQRARALALDVAHRLNGRPRGPTPTRGGRHEGAAAIVRIDDPRDPTALLEAVQQPGERRRAVQQMSLQLTNGVRLAVGEH